jgi:hypothetical protein
VNVWSLNNPHWLCKDFPNLQKDTLKFLWVKGHQAAANFPTVQRKTMYLQGEENY